MVVDLPAPFGPTNPVTCPGETVNVMPSRARAGPNRLRSPATSMVASHVQKARERGTRRSSRDGAVFAVAAWWDTGTGRVPRAGDGGTTSGAMRPY